MLADDILAAEAALGMLTNHLSPMAAAVVRMVRLNLAAIADQAAELESQVVVVRVLEKAAVEAAQ